MEHSFDVEVAEEFGVNAAILFKNIAFWCAKNKANGTNIHDGVYWTYNSVAAFKELFPYLSDKQIRTALKKLEESEVIKTGNYNKDQRDRTTWYALTDYGSSIFHKGNLHLTKGTNEDCQKGEPLPVSKPDTKPNKNKDIRHKHGEYQNVLLSDTDLAKLKEEFPSDWQERIERLSGYMASTGKSYKNHLATIRNWAKRDKASSKPKEPEYVPSDTTEWDF